jgi:hypothetical protein
MSPRLLAFFDTRYQSAPDIAAVTGGRNPWDALRAARPLSRTHAPLNLPGTLGAYDLTARDQAALVVAFAASAGLNGFVVDCHPTATGYTTGAAALTPALDDGFGLAFQWPVGRDPFWRARADAESRMARARALIAALGREAHVRADGRTILIVERPDLLGETARSLDLLRRAAAEAGHAGLYIIASQAEEVDALSLGYDALVDPSPGDWASCTQTNIATGSYDLLETLAGLRDSSELTDRYFTYNLFIISRMIDRRKRGKVFPRVFPFYQDWATHPEGGATLLFSRGLIGSNQVNWPAFGRFVENGMTYAAQNFAPEESLCFLHSWNQWLDGSQVEPSALDGDLVYNALKDAIAKARFVIATDGGMRAEIDPAMQAMIESACAAGARLHAA